jgi:hypothetical protein
MELGMNGEIKELHDTVESLFKFLTQHGAHLSFARKAILRDKLERLAVESLMAYRQPLKLEQDLIVQKGDSNDSES